MREYLYSLPSAYFPPKHTHFTLFPRRRFCFLPHLTPKQRPPSQATVHAMEVGGSDSDGREFKNADEMWREQVGDPSKKTDWYHQGVGYWQVCKTLLAAFSYLAPLFFIFVFLAFIVPFRVEFWFLGKFVCVLTGFVLWKRRAWRHRWMGYWEGMGM